jgi:hypothetical protein
MILFVLPVLLLFGIVGYLYYRQRQVQIQQESNDKKQVQIQQESNDKKQVQIQQESNDKNHLIRFCDNQFRLFFDFLRVIIEAQQTLFKIKEKNNFYDLDSTTYFIADFNSLVKRHVHPPFLENESIKFAFEHVAGALRVFNANVQTDISEPNVQYDNYTMEQISTLIKSIEGMTRDVVHESIRFCETHHLSDNFNKNNFVEDAKNLLHQIDQPKHAVNGKHLRNLLLTAIMTTALQSETISFYKKYSGKQLDWKQLFHSSDTEQLLQISNEIQHLSIPTIPKDQRPSMSDDITTFKRSFSFSSRIGYARKSRSRVRSYARRRHNRRRRSRRITKKK